VIVKAIQSTAWQLEFEFSVLGFIWDLWVGIWDLLRSKVRQLEFEFSVLGFTG